MVKSQKKHLFSVNFSVSSLTKQRKLKKTLFNQCASYCCVDLDCKGYWVVGMSEGDDKMDRVDQ